MGETVEIFVGIILGLQVLGLTAVIWIGYRLELLEIETRTLVSKWDIEFGHFPRWSLLVVRLRSFDEMPGQSPTSKEGSNAHQ